MECHLLPQLFESQTPSKFRVAPPPPTRVADSHHDSTLGPQSSRGTTFFSSRNHGVNSFSSRCYSRHACPFPITAQQCGGLDRGSSKPAAAAAAAGRRRCRWPRGVGGGGILRGGRRRGARRAGLGSEWWNTRKMILRAERRVSKRAVWANITAAFHKLR